MWKLEMGGAVTTYKGDKYFSRKIYITQNEIPKIREKFNNTDVYATVMSYEDVNNQNSTNMIGQMYIDLDMKIENNKDYISLVQDLRLIVTYLKLHYGIDAKFLKFYFTGQKGFHIMINPVLLGVEPNAKLHMVYKEIAKELNEITINKPVDLKIYDTKRLFRLPNSINGKSGKYKVPISYFNVCSFNYERMLEYASSPKELIQIPEVKTIQKANEKYKGFLSSIEKKKEKKFFIPTNIDVKDIKFLPCVQNLYRNGALDGSRNQSTVVLACSLLQQGVNEEIAFQMVSKWNAERNSPSLEDSEVQTTFDSAVNIVESGRRYGCSSMKDLGYCVGTDCNLYR